MFDQPNWPARDWLRRHAEEALFGDHNPDSTVKSFFSEEKPSTPAGKIALARVLARDGEFDAAGALARQLWREEDFNETIEGVLRKEFSDFLTVADHKYRADRLLYAEKNAAAMRAAELAGKDVVALARVRAAANSDYGSEKLFATVPASLQNDPGLIYARVHLLRKQQKIAEAAALLRNAPREPERVIDGDAWWVERRLVARKLLDLGDAQGAYAICAQHSAHGVNARSKRNSMPAGSLCASSTTSPAPSDISNFWRKSRKRQPKNRARPIGWRERPRRDIRLRKTPTPTTITPKRRRIRPRFTASWR